MQGAVGMACLADMHYVVADALQGGGHRVG